MKLMIYGGATVGSLIFGLIGSKWGGPLGFPSLALGVLGTFVGIFVGYKIGKSMDL